MKAISASNSKLAEVLNQDEMRNIALLVFAIKQDLPHAMSIGDISEEMGLHDLHSMRWHVTCGTCRAVGNTVNTWRMA